MKSETLIKSVMENYPEAGDGTAMTCINWNYDDVKFVFQDSETERIYTIGMEELKKGLEIFVELVRKGKYFNNLIAPNLLSEGYGWDADDCDALVQCSTLGGIEYG